MHSTTHGEGPPGDSRLAVRFLLVVLTPALFTSKPCLAEINTAYKNKVQVIPILFEDTSEVKAQWSMITKNSDFDEKEMVRLCTYEHALSRHFAGWKRKKKGPCKLQSSYAESYIRSRPRTHGVPVWAHVLVAC